jgi:hypothetical protein
MLGSGTEEDPYRADVPENVNWVGQPGGDGTFLIATPKELPPKAGRVQRFKVANLKAAAEERKLKYEHVEGWYVSS